MVSEPKRVVSDDHFSCYNNESFFILVDYVMCYIRVISIVREQVSVYKTWQNHGYNDTCERNNFKRRQNVLYFICTNCARCRMECTFTIILWNSFHVIMPNSPVLWISDLIKSPLFRCAAAGIHKHKHANCKTMETQLTLLLKYLSRFSLLLHF